MPEITHKYIGALIMLGGVVLLGASIFYLGQPHPPPPHPFVGSPAPPLTLPTLDGGTFTLADHVDKDVVVLDFWATWCGPCRAYMPMIERVVDEFKDDNVVLYSINNGESIEAIERYLKQSPVSNPIVLDEDFIAVLAYEAAALPYTVLIGRDGRIQMVASGMGLGVDDMIRDAIKRLVRGEDLYDPRQLAEAGR